MMDDLRNKSDQERAIYYDAHGDDLDQWGDGEGPDSPRERRNLSATIAVRFAPDEANLLREAARQRRISYSNLVREAVREYLQPQFSVTTGNIMAIYAPPSPVIQKLALELGGNLRPASEIRTGVRIAS